MDAKKYINKESYTLEDLNGIMKLLRVGCPWDKEQTHESIRQNFIEEVYEVCDAIDKKDSELLCEELGDVLLQVVFHACMEEEKGVFALGDAVDGVCRKLILRHPHVFGEITVNSTGEVLSNWDKIKEDSKGQKTVRDTLVDIPKALPALMRAQKTAKRAAKGSYELEALYEGMTKEQAEQEIGKRLFELCSSAQRAGIDAEGALSAYCDDFIDNFPQ